MRSLWGGWVVVVLAGLVVGSASAQERNRGRGRGRGASPREVANNGWLSSYRQAREQARQTGQPLMLVFRCVP